MRIRHAVMGGAAFVTIMSWAVLSFAQATRLSAEGTFKIKRIDQRFVLAPNLKGAATGEATTGAKMQRKWLEIETTFDSAPDWADDVSLKYHVMLINKEGEARMFGGEITYINVEKGRGHLSAIYMHPNTVVRYGRGSVEGVHVELWYKGQRIDQETQPPAKARWWEGSEPVKGFLLNPQQTPWLVFSERFESIKPSGRSD